MATFVKTKTAELSAIIEQNEHYCGKMRGKTRLNGGCAASEPLLSPLAESKMKVPLTIVAPCSFLLLAQAPIAWAVWIASLALRRNWAEMLPNETLPAATTAAPDYGLLIPVAVAVVAATCLCVDWRNGTSRLFYPFITAICEPLLLAFFAMGLSLPALTITYTIGE